MANAKKCDICGKLYERYSGIPLTPGGNKYHALALIDQKYDGKFFDICPECMQQVIHFLNTASKYCLQCNDCKHLWTCLKDAPRVDCKRVNPGCDHDRFEYDEKKVRE